MQILLGGGELESFQNYYLSKDSMIAGPRAVALKRNGTKGKSNSDEKNRKRFFCYVHQIVSVHQKSLCLHCTHWCLAAMQIMGVNSRAQSTAWQLDTSIRRETG